MGRAVAGDQETVPVLGYMLEKMLGKPGLEPLALESHDGLMVTGFYPLLHLIQSLLISKD